MEKLKKVILSLNKEERTILNIVQKSGPISKNELFAVTGIKLTTLNRIMVGLRDKRLIMECGKGGSTGGRNPKLYDVNLNIGYIIGVDISRTYFEIIIVNFKMNVLLKNRYLKNELYDIRNVIDIICEKISKALSNLDIEIHMVLGIGIGLASIIGSLDMKKGLLINTNKFIRKASLNEFAINMFYEKLKLPVVIDSGSNAAVLSEYIWGFGKEYENIAYFNCDTDIQTGIIYDGIVLRNINNDEDYFAHMIIDIYGKKCRCGNNGCVEAYVSTLSITEGFLSQIKKGRFTNIQKSISDINYLDICMAAEDGDELAKEVINYAAIGLGIGIANYVNMLNLQIIILSGALVNVSNVFYEECKRVVNKSYYISKNRNIFFRRGGFFNESAVSMGGAVMLMEKVLNNITIDTYLT